MPATILIVTYLPSAAHREAPAEEWHAAAGYIGALVGLQWKYWIRSMENDSFGGVYLFDTPDQARAGDGQVEQSLASAGAREIELRLFEVDAELSALTRGLIAEHR